MTIYEHGLFILLIIISNILLHSCHLYIPDVPASITARHPNHAAPYITVGTASSVKQYRIPTISKMTILMTNTNFFKTDFLIYIKTHLSLTGFPFDRSILTDQACHKTDSCSLVFYFS